MRIEKTLCLVFTKGLGFMEGVLGFRIEVLDTHWNQERAGTEIWG
jgi:hypothetical protein